MVKKFFCYLSVFVIIFSVFPIKNASAVWDGYMFKDAFFTNWNDTSEVIGIHPDRARKMYVWKSASTIDDPKNSINGDTIRLEINKAYKSWENMYEVDINVVAETTDWDAATLRFYAMDFEVDADGYVVPSTKGKANGIITPVSLGEKCDSIDLPLNSKDYQDCEGDRFNYVKLYINVPKMKRDQKAKEEKKANGYEWTNNDIIGTIAHEIGHALGFRHQPDSADSIMEQTGIRKRSIIGPQGIDHANALWRFHHRVE